MQNAKLVQCRACIAPIKPSLEKTLIMEPDFHFSLSSRGRSNATDVGRKEAPPAAEEATAAAGQALGFAQAKRRAKP